MGDAVPGTRLELDRVLLDRVIHLADPVPICHGLTDDFPCQPQSRPGGPAVFCEFLAAGIDVWRLEAGHAQRQKRHDDDGYDGQEANLQCLQHLRSPYGQPYHLLTTRADWCWE